MPRLDLFLRLDGRAADGAEEFRGVFIVDAVAIAQAEPRDEAAIDQIVDDVVQPCEIIDAFLLFRTGPSGLEADPFDAEGGDFVIGLRRIEDGAVKLFETDSATGMRDFRRMDGNDFCNGFQIVHDDSMLIGYSQAVWMGVS